MKILAFMRFFSFREYTYAFIGANATGARRREARLADRDVSSADLTAVSGLAPGSKVHVGHGAARYAWVQEITGEIERRPLHVRLVIHVLAHHLGQGSLA